MEPKTSNDCIDALIGSMLITVDDLRELKQKELPEEKKEAMIKFHVGCLMRFFHSSLVDA